MPMPIMLYICPRPVGIYGKARDQEKDSKGIKRPVESEGCWDSRGKMGESCN